MALETPLIPVQKEFLRPPDGGGPNRFGLLHPAEEENMVFGRSVISRRTVLRGMLAGGFSVAVPLPRLCAMLNGNGTAYAAGGALPVRFGFWFFGNGIIPERWVPTTTGSAANWTLSQSLQPLEPVKPWLSVVTGTNIKIPDNAPHSSFPPAALSGAYSAP